MNRRTGSAGHRTLPLHGWIGLLLVAVFWPLNWFLTGLRTHILFFPLWLGYSLAVDGLTFMRSRSSLFSRNRGIYRGLFFASAPLWWLFELLNKRVQNWQYLGEEHFTAWQFFLLSTLSFSTVIPALFGTAELWSTFLPPLKGPVLRPGRPAAAQIFILGLLMLLLLLAWPRYFFPLLWLSLFLICEPMNIRLGFPSVTGLTKKGRWRPIAALCLGSLTCGFFWEMWNFYSFPKWVYTIPFVGFARIFEMPILGYGGYLPFALEVYVLYHLITGLLRVKTEGIPFPDDGPDADSE